LESKKIADFHEKAQTQQYSPTFIVITAFDDAAPKEIAKKYKVKAFIKKPFAEEELVCAALDGVREVYSKEVKQLDMLHSMYSKKLEQLGKADDFLDKKKAE